MPPKKVNNDDDKLDRLLKQGDEHGNMMKAMNAEIKEIKVEIKEIKVAMKELQTTVTELKVVVEKHQVAIDEVGTEINRMKAEIEDKDKLIGALDLKTETMEQALRMNDVILSGLKISPRSYAAALQLENETEDEEPERRSMEQQVSEFLESKGIDFDVSTIEACYSLSRKANTGKPAVLLKFVNRRDKIALLKQGKNLKGSPIFLNENLTRKNAEIAKSARNVRKAGKIQRTWTNNCKIFIKLNGPPENAKVVWIRSRRFGAVRMTESSSAIVSSSSR